MLLMVLWIALFQKLKNIIASNGEVDFSKLTDMSVYVNKTVTYIPLIGTVMGLYIIVCVVKCSIEIGVRMFKLIALQILAPAAIITIIQDGVKGKTFKSFYDTYIKIYLEAFIRVASMLISIVFICKFIKGLEGLFADSILVKEEGKITKGLLTIIVVVAGFRFASEVPKFIDSILGTHMADSKGGFGSFVGGLVGGTVGGATALGATIAGGGGIGTGLANMVSGQVRGFSAGAKGNNISDKIKNISGANAKTKSNVVDMISRGGLGAVVGGTIGTAVGTKARQDRQMETYDKQTAALDRFDTAQKEAIADKSMLDLMNDSSDTTDFSKYSSGFENTKFSSDKDAYVAKMLEFDTDYQYAKSQYDSISSDTTKTAGEITAAQQNLLEVREKAKKRAATIYDDHKNSAGGAEVEKARTDVEKSGIDISHGIDVKKQKAEIKEQKRELENKQSYKNTHSGTDQKLSVKKKVEDIKENRAKEKAAKAAEKTKAPKNTTPPSEVPKIHPKTPKIPHRPPKNT